MLLNRLHLRIFNRHWIHAAGHGVSHSAFHWGVNMHFWVDRFSQASKNGAREIFVASHVGSCDIHGIHGFVKGVGLHVLVDELQVVLVKASNFKVNSVWVRHFKVCAAHLVALRRHKEIGRFNFAESEERSARLDFLVFEKKDVVLSSLAFNSVLKLEVHSPIVSEVSCLYGV